MRVLPLTRLTVVLAVVLSSTLFSCTDEKEEFQTEALADYMPLAVGKYITYRVDSMVFTVFGRNTEIHKYQFKHIVDAVFTDNAGRTSYRINTFYRDSVDLASWTPTQPWINSKTYYITPLENQIEVVDENNFRQIKLHLPFREDYSWKGNKYLGNQPYQQFFNFSNDDNMATWDYTYSALAPLFSYRGINYSNVYHVAQEDEKTLIDTFKVSATNQVLLPEKTLAAWINGNSTATITVSATPPPNGQELRIYNYSNNALKLGDVITPSGYSRNYEFINGQWAFGTNGNGVRKDTLFTETPYGSKTYFAEKYAKSTGLVFRQQEIWEYQPSASPSGGFKIGFGITMWMIDHN